MDVDQDLEIPAEPLSEGCEDVVGSIEFSLRDEPLRRAERVQFQARKPTSTTGSAAATNFSGVRSVRYQPLA